MPLSDFTSIRDTATIEMECSGGAHTQERCLSAESFRQWEGIVYWDIPKAQGPVKNLDNKAHEKIHAEIE